MATKSRSRKAKSSSESPLAALAPQRPSGVADQVPDRVSPSDEKNVSPFEGTLSIYAGALLVVAALFPRSFKQLLLLGLGAGFIYRGQSRHCHLYSTLGIDTNKTSLPAQLGKTLFS